jgi:predicted amidohydrolase
MRIALVQTRPAACEIAGNISAHESWIERVASHGADLVLFPELSLLGYEPKHAARFAMRADDARLDVFAMLSQALRITIGVGAPTRGDAGVRISMLVFQPNAARLVYSKQHLHADELPYFVAGNGQITLRSGGQVVAPAICYESLLDCHSDAAAALGATVYAASVAKSAAGVAKADAHYPSIARRHSLRVLMVNCVGACDDFEAVGWSSVWSSGGELVARLSATDEAALLLDTATDETRAIVS